MSVYAPPGLSSGGGPGGGFPAGLLGNSCVGSGSIMMGDYDGSWGGGGGGALSLDFNSMGLDDSQTALSPPDMGVGTPSFGHMGGGFGSSHLTIGPPKSASVGNSIASPIGSGHGAGSVGAPVGHSGGLYPTSPTDPSSNPSNSQISAASLSPVTEESTAPPAVPASQSTSRGTSSGSAGGHGGPAWTGPSSSVAIVNAGASAQTQPPAAPANSPRHSQPPPYVKGTASGDSPSTTAPSGGAGTSASYAGGGSRRNMAWESVDWVCPQYGKDCGFGPSKCTHGPIRNGNNGWDSVDWTCPKYGKGCKFGPEKCSHK